MSQALPPRPRQTSYKRAITIVASEYNAEFVQALIDNTVEELTDIAPTTTVTLRQVPGAFEIPLAVQEVARHEKADAVIALGVVIEGETFHAELICRTITDSLQRISLEYHVPVIHEVLYVRNEEQARERCLGKKINRGAEAAGAAVAMIQLMNDLQEKR